MRLDLAWQAVQVDGGIVNEADFAGHHWDIFKLELAEFRLIDQNTGQLVVMVLLDKNKRLIYRARPTQQVLIDMAGLTPISQAPGPKCWVVGWQETKRAVPADGPPTPECVVNMKALFIIHDNGMVHLMERLPKGQRLDRLAPQEIEAGIRPEGLVKGVD